MARPAASRPPPRPRVPNPDGQTLIPLPPPDPATTARAAGSPCVLPLPAGPLRTPSRRRPCPRPPRPRPRRRPRARRPGAPARTCGRRLELGAPARSRLARARLQARDPQQVVVADIYLACVWLDNIKSLYCNVYLAVILVNFELFYW